jgi:membrane protease YdiL (CAAX protease family)
MNHTINRPVDKLVPPAEQANVRVIHTSQEVPALFRLVALLYIAMVIMAEVVTMFVSVITGSILYGVLLIIVVNLSYFSKKRLIRRIYLAFTLLPLLRILSLAMPIQQVPPVFQYILTGVPLLLSTIFVISANGLPAFRLNLSSLEWVYQIIIGVSGIPLGLIAALTLKPPPSLINKSNLLWIFLLWVVFTLFGAVMEEVIFRGILQKALSYTFGASSIILTSLLYAGMFMGTLSPGYILFYGLTGLLFSIWVQISDSLAGVIVAHSLMNIVFLLFVYLFR